MVILVWFEVPEVIIPVKLSVVVHQWFETDVIGSSSPSGLHSISII